MRRRCEPRRRRARGADGGRGLAFRLLCVLGASAVPFLWSGCSYDQPARWPKGEWTEFHRELKTQMVDGHRAPLEGKCPAASPSPRLAQFDRLWKNDMPWPPVKDFDSQVGTLDDFEIALGYAYLSAKDAAPRRAYVVFADHSHRFPGSLRGVIGRAHAHLTVGDLSSAEQTLAAIPGVPAADAGSARRGVPAPADAQASADVRPEADFLRWLIGYLNVRPGVAGGMRERGPEKKGAEDLAGAQRLVNFVGMEQLKEPPRPGPLSYVGFILTPVTFFGERVVELAEREDVPRLPRWPDLGVLPGRDAGAPEPWYVADFLRAQAPADPKLDRGWEDRSARFLACSLKPRWAGLWVPRLHDAPDLGYFPHFPEIYAAIGRLSLAQGEAGRRPSVDDLCDALVALLFSSHQDPDDPVVASEIGWLWYAAMQRDDPRLVQRQPFLDPQHRFGEFAVLWGADLVLQGALPKESESATVRELHARLQAAGALTPVAPFEEDGPLVLASIRLLAAMLYQIGPEVRQERAEGVLTTKAQELLKRIVVQPQVRREHGEGSFAGAREDDPWRLTPRVLPGAAHAAGGAAKGPLEPWYDPVFAEYEWLLESWLGALENEYRGDPAVLARCALVRDRLWRREE